MNNAIIFIRNEEEKQLAKAPYLGGNLLLHTIKTLKKIDDLDEIYVVGNDSEVPGSVKKDTLSEVIEELDPRGKSILVSPLYPSINAVEYEKLLNNNDTGSVIVNNGEICEAFAIPNANLEDYKNLKLEPVEIVRPIRKFTVEDEINSRQESLNDVVVFPLTSSVGLVNEVCHYLNIKPGAIEVKHFADGETLVELGETVRGKRIYIIQSTCKPVNEKLMELLIAVDAVRRSSAAEINCIIPYYGYARQDRKAQPRQPITAKLVAAMLEEAGVNRVITFDLHAAQIEGFFHCPVDNLTTVPMMGKYFCEKEFDPDEVVVVSPDHGGVKRARNLAEMLHCAIAIIDKRRPQANVAEAMNVIGDVKDKHVIIIDDIIDTGGSLIAAVNILKEHGCKDVYVTITHGIFSHNATMRIQDSGIKELVVTNTIEPDKEEMDKTTKVTVLSIGWMLSKMILAVSCHTPVSEVYSLYEVD